MTETITINTPIEYVSDLTGCTYKSESSMKRAETIHLKNASRVGKRITTVEIGIDDTYSKPKKPLLEQLFVEAKWITNDIVSHLRTDDGKLKDWDYTKKSVTVRMGKNSDTYEDRELTVIGAAMKQSLKRRTGSNLSSLHALKENGHKVGALGYVKSVDSIPLRSIGNDYNIDLENRKVYIANIGWLKAHGLKQLPQDADIANAVLLKTPTKQAYATTSTKVIPIAWKTSSSPSPMTTSETSLYNTQIYPSKLTWLVTLIDSHTYGYKKTTTT